LTFQGTRQLVLTPMMTLIDYMSTSSTIPVDLTMQAQTRARAANVLKAMSKEGMPAYHAAGGTIFHGTVGPNDIIYIPAGTFFAEKVTSREDIVGARVPLIPPAVAESKAFHEMIAKAHAEKGKQITEAACVARGYIEMQVVAASSAAVAAAAAAVAAARVPLAPDVGAPAKKDDAAAPAAVDAPKEDAE
jgi:hypothetical protein